MTAAQYAKEFLSHKKIKDVNRKVVGELHELATDHATYFYGNGELIVSPADDTEDFIFWTNEKDQLVLDS